MLSHYFKMAYRANLRNKLHSALNIFGLTIGLAAAMLVALFAQHELSYDTWQPNAEQTYRVDLDWSNFGFDVNPSANLQRAQQFKNIGGVEDVFGLISVNDSSLSTVKHGNKRFKLDGLFIATDNITDFIDLIVLEGDLQQALNQPWSIALGQSEAHRIFGDNSGLGQALSTKNGVYTVAAIFEDLPQNTHFYFTSLTYNDAYKDDLRTHMHSVYLRLVDTVELTSLVSLLSESYTIGDEIGRLKIQLAPLMDIHLHHISVFKIGGAWQTVVLCFFLSGLLVSVACINFVNMSVAQVVRRAKEAGVRKALGANKWQLVFQYLLETWLLTLVAVFSACILVDLSMPWVEQLLQRQFSLSIDTFNVAILIVLSVFVTMIAGIYPALFLSSFSAHTTLSGELVHGSSAVVVRKVLLTFQAALSIGLISAILIFNGQLKALQIVDTGFANDSRLIISGIPNDAIYTQTPSRVLSELNRLDDVEMTMPLDTQLTDSFLYSFELTFPNGSKTENTIPAVGTGFQAAKNLGLTLLAGRDFELEHASDWFVYSDGASHASILITESLAYLSGFKTVEDAVGQVFIRDELTLKVVGVVKDVVLGGTRESYSNVLFICGFTLTSNMNVILTHRPDILLQQKTALINSIEEILADELDIFEPNISRVSDNANANIAGDKRLLQIISLFAVLVIIIACVGLFGLASFATHQRRREIAIRKVIGASRLSIVNLLAREFLALVCIGIVIAWPLNYWLMEQWLQEFNERISQSILVYIFSTLLVLLVTWLTVGCLAFKAASERPSKVLKSE